MMSEAQRYDNVVKTLSDVATKIQPNVVRTSCASWDRVKLNQLSYEF